MSDKNKISNDEKKWRAESDAYTIAEYAKIATDPERMAAAIAEAKKKAKDLREQADGIEAISKVIKKDKKSK